MLNYPYPYTLRPNPYFTLPSLLLFFTFLPMMLHGYREHGVTT